MRNVLTIDVEDWYHVCGIEKRVPRSEWHTLESRVEPATRRLLDLLDQAQVKATFFVLGCVAEQHPQLVREIRDAGHEVGSHGYWHQKVFHQTPAEFEEDVRRSRDLLEQILGVPPRTYRAPEWSIDRDRRWAYPILRQLGFEDDSSVMPMSWIGGADLEVDPFRHPTEHGDLRVYPATCMRLYWENLPFLGGLAYRVTPYCYTISALEHMNRRGRPGMVYLHPWEFDRKQPRLPMGPVVRFMHAFNLRSVAFKTERLLRYLPFGTMREALDEMLPRQESTATTEVRSDTSADATETCRSPAA